MSDQTAIANYETLLRPARARLDDDVALRALLDPAMEPTRLERFLISFSARGVQMTEPVPSWIRRAGRRCLELGFDELGDALVAHARHEAGHHLLMIDDARLLVQRWNARHDPPLDVAVLLAEPPNAAMRAYAQLHEHTIAGSSPFAQVAIEYEIERMSVVLGPPLIANCRRVLGDPILDGLSFIREHVAADVGHTQLNRRMLSRLLETHPSETDRVARAGALALAAYVDFLIACIP